jgi:hypothetical protein
MSDEINVLSRTQIIFVEPTSGSVAVLNAGPMGVAGPEGPSGGDPGPPGADGVGVPTGGTAGQVLTKDTSTDFDTSWQTPTGGGSGIPINDSDSNADFSLYHMTSENGAWAESVVSNNDPAGTGYRGAQIALRGDPNADAHTAGAEIAVDVASATASARAAIDLFADKTSPSSSQIELLAGTGTRQSGLFIRQDGVTLFTQLDASAPAPVFDLGKVQVAPANPPAQTARLFCRDNGSGKMQLVVRFPTGAVIVLATEP